MAKNECRDCKMCTRSRAEGCMILGFHLSTFFIFKIMIEMLNLFRKKCPECGHPLGDHHRRKDGSFKD